MLVRGEIINDTDLDIAAEQSRGQALPREWLNDDLPSAVAKLEKEMIVRALEQCRGNRTEAARQLKINRQLLYNKMYRPARPKMRVLPMRAHESDCPSPSG